MATEPNYFGVSLGNAIAAGAGHIASGLEKRYALQREKEAQDRAIGLQFAGVGIGYDPANPHLAFSEYAKSGKMNKEMEMRKMEAETARLNFQATPAGTMGGMVPSEGYQFLTGPGGVQYVPTKYGPKFVPPEPIAINPNTGEQTVLPRGGKIVEPSGSKEAKQVLSKVRGFNSAINELESILTTVPSGRIVGGVAKVLNNIFGIYPQVRTSESLSGMMVPMATRIIGGDVGNLSETEQKAARRALELASGTTEERKQSIGLLRALLDTKKAEAENIIRGKDMGIMPQNTEALKATRTLKNGQKVNVISYDNGTTWQGE